MLASTTWGSGDRHVLLIHGLGSNKEGWWRVGPWFAERGWTAHAVDLLGHGASPKPPSYTLDLLAAHLPRRDGRWDLVLGHSLGGAVSVRAASGGGFAERLVLEDPLLFLPDLEVSLPIALSEFDIPLTAEAQAADNPTWHPEDARIKAEALRQCGPGAVEAVTRGLRGLNLVDEIRSVEVPTLVVGAAMKPLVPAALGEGLASMAPHVDFLTVPDSSHSIHRDEFDALMVAIERWMGNR